MTLSGSVSNLSGLAAIEIIQGTLTIEGTPLTTLSLPALTEVTGDPDTKLSGIASTSTSPKEERPTKGLSSFASN